MGVADARQVVGAALELHRQHAFVDQLGHVGADQVHAQDGVGLGMRQHLHEARRLGHRHRAADRREREAAGLVRDALGLQLLLGLADPGDFRLGVDHPRDGVEVDVARQAGDQLGHRDAFLEALVRQHRAAHAVTHRPHAVDAGVAVRVDHDLAALVELDAGAVGQQALGGGAAAHGHQQLVHHQFLRGALVIGVADVHAVLLDLGGGALAAQLDVQALLLEFARGDLAHFRVGRGEEVRQAFEDGDLGAQALPHAAQLQADHAGADHAQALRHGFQVERADVVDDVLAELGERQLDGIRAGGEDHVGGLQLDFGTVVLLDLDHVARLPAVCLESAKAVERGDLVGLEQRRDAAGELLHDAVLAGDHLLHVDRRRLEADAVLVEEVAHVPELAAGIQQRLGRDAAHAQAGAAQGRLAVLAQRGVDAGGLQAQLRGADGGVITGRAGTDDNDVESLLFAHLTSPAACGVGFPTGS